MHKEPYGPQNAGDIDLAFTPEIGERTAAIYEKVKHIIPEVEWAAYAPYIAAINDLKKERNAVILAHNYMTPAIYHGIADFRGDSLGLAKQASRTQAEIIVMCGVHFMAETAKLLNPEKTVLIPDPEAGCSLADSITPEDVRLLKERYPGVPVVTYVNTTAAVKAECDICCTSSNALQVVESLEGDQVIFLPDEYLGRYVAGQTSKKVILWKGHCEVHEKFTAEEIKTYRRQYPDIVVLAHPECPPDVLAEADYVGSTSGMINYVGQRRPARVVMITECSMSDNVAAEYPEITFIRPCNLCTYMKKIELPKVLRSLQTLQHRVEVPDDIAQRARQCVERMLQLGQPQAR